MSDINLDFEAITKIIDAYSEKLESVSNETAFYREQKSVLEVINRDILEYESTKAPDELLRIKSRARLLLTDLSNEDVATEFYKTAEFAALENVLMLVDDMLAKQYPMADVANIIIDKLTTMKCKDVVYKAEQGMLIHDINFVVATPVIKDEVEKYQIMAELLLYQYKATCREKACDKGILAHCIENLLTEDNKKLKPVQEAAQLKVTIFVNNVKKVLDDKSFWGKQDNPDGMKEVQKIIDSDVNNIKKWAKICNFAKKHSLVKHHIHFGETPSANSPLHINNRTLATQEFYKVLSSGEEDKVGDFFEKRMANQNNTKPPSISPK